MPSVGGRILSVAQIVRPASGGIRSHVRTLVTGLDRNRFASEIFAPSNPGLAPELAAYMPTSIAPRLQPVSDLAAILKLTAKLRHRVDVVHAHGLRGALIGVTAARLARVPAIFTAHNLAPNLSTVQRAILRRLARDAERVVAVSEAVAATIVALGVPRDRITVIPNGIDIGPFQCAYDTVAVRAAYDIHGPTPLIVAIGRLSHEKGFDVLLQAYRQVHAAIPDARLIIAGDGVEAAALKALAPEDVRFAGRIENVVPLLQAADIVALPSRLEGQGIVALEAMAAGRPVIASRIGGLMETVVEGETGLLVPAEDATALADGLSKLIASADLRARLGGAGRERVKRGYTANHMIATISALYETICAAR
jgi:glycosyltransferase involved in cell wall biosynthesis